MSQKTSKGGNQVATPVSVSSDLDQKCPYCHSQEWVRIRRAWWQKLTHRHEGLCYCLSCRKRFWRRSFWQG